MIQKSTSLRHEPSSEPLRIPARPLFLNRELYLAGQLSAEEGTIFERLHREAMQRELKREVVLLSTCFLVDSYVVSWFFSFQLLLGLRV